MLRALFVSPDGGSGEVSGSAARTQGVDVPTSASSVGISLGPG